MSKLSVAMVSPWAVKCGISTYSAALSEALAKEGAEVYIMRHPRFGRKTNKAFEHLTAKTPPDVDVIHIQHEYGLYTTFNEVLYGYLKRYGKPIVTTMHAIGNWEIDSLVKANSDEVITHNKFCHRRFGYDSTIIPHGCKPVETIDKQKAKVALGIPPNIPIVGYVGFISAAKGLETLFEVMAKIKTTGIFIGGGWHTTADSSNYIQQLRRRADTLLPGRIQWYGFVPEDKLQIVYSAMDIVVYPSRWATESGALLMAMSHGKAIVANRLPPFRSKEKEGALITFKNIKDLRRKIKKLLKDDELREKVEEGARNYTFENRWEAIAKKHISLYEGVLKSDS